MLAFDTRGIFDVFDFQRRPRAATVCDLGRRHARDRLIANETVPRIIINDTINFVLNCNQHFGNFKP